MFTPLGITTPSNTINPPTALPYSDPQAWVRYERKLEQTNQLMQADGWTKGAGGIWTKDGQPASFTITTTAGFPRRRLIEEMLQRQLRSAGFALKIKNEPIAQLFGQTLPSGNYDLALYAQVSTSLQPGLCTIFCTANIPAPANGNSGQNWQRVSTAADVPLTEVETSTDDAARRAAGMQADQILATEQVSLPLDPLPNILLWNKRIVGPVHDDPILGMFGNLQAWGLVKPKR
jgi:peptide/nickel transport system substrate-binding protein